VGGVDHAVAGAGHVLAVFDLEEPSRAGSTASSLRPAEDFSQGWYNVMIAALLPSLRASRLPVLTAIATE
jgi:hypothetical protein